MNILINKAHYPVLVLGYGKRIGIWFQGCSIHCPSCCSLDTWDFEADRSIAVESLVDWCREVSGGAPDGVTISGGEPFDQPDGLLALLKELDRWRAGLPGGFDVLVYSGYPERAIRRNFGEHLEYVDAVVAGPYKKNAGGSKPYCGSDNQEIVVCTPLGENRYGTERREDWKTGMQAAADQAGIWMIGIPRPDDLDRLERRCLEKGLVLESLSWRC